MRKRKNTVSGRSCGVPISSKGFIDIFTLLVSTPELSDFTRIFTA